jgi:hypothetical protein
MGTPSNEPLGSVTGGRISAKSEDSPEGLCSMELKAIFILRKVAGSKPDEVFFFNLPNPSGRTRPWGLLSL